MECKMLSYEKRKCEIVPQTSLYVWSVRGIYDAWYMKSNFYRVSNLKEINVVADDV